MRANSLTFYLVPTKISASWASLSALSDELTSGDWLCCDPVELIPDLHQVYLVGNTHLNLQPQEIIQLQHDIQNILPEPLRLFIPDPYRWYLRIPKPCRLKTHSLNKVVGKNIFTYLPEGSEQNYWQKLFTELQMFLATHPVNEERRQQQLPMVNALWFYHPDSFVLWMLQRKALLKKYFGLIKSTFS